MYQLWLYFTFINIAVILTGYAVIRKKMCWQSWVLLVVSILAVHLVFLKETPLIRMLVLISTTFTGMKVISTTVSYQYKPFRLSLIQWFLFCIAWAGMRAELFESPRKESIPGACTMIRFGVIRLIMGAILIVLVHLIAGLPINPNLRYHLVSAILLIGFSLILHFGILSITAGAWRLFGVNTNLLFKSPSHSSSLTEFWSKRWNLAFSEMTAIAIIRPLRKKIGYTMSILLAFTFSGFLHELALSIPVKSGYGLPMLYFIVQGVLVLVERFLERNHILSLRNPIAGKLWVFFWLIVPVPLLFHKTFLEQIVWKLAGLD